MLYTSCTSLINHEQQINPSKLSIALAAVTKWHSAEALKHLEAHDNSQHEQQNYQETGVPLTITAQSPYEANESKKVRFFRTLSP